MRTNFPLAFHITFGTYGTRLHGDHRGTVDRSKNNYGDPIIGRNDDWSAEESAMLKFPRRILTIEQRIAVEQLVPEICIRGGWQHIATAGAPDHVHNLVGANADGKDVRKWLKRWLSETMSQRWPTLPGQSWWAECGSVKWVWKPDYYDRAVDYVVDQKTWAD